MRKHTQVGTGILLAVITLSACQKGVEIDAGNPYSEEFRLAVQDAATDHERDMLSDGAVTDQEYREMLDAYVTCMIASGVDIEVHGSGSKTRYRTTDSGAFEKHDPTCRTGTIEHIEPLYISLNQNPENEDWNTIVARCLVREGVVTDPYSGRELESDLISDPQPKFVAGEEYRECSRDPLATGF